MSDPIVKPGRILHVSVARDIVTNLVSEHALKQITEHLAEYAYDALVDEDIDALGPAAWKQAVAEIREEIATLTLTCEWDGNADEVTS